MRPEEQCGNLSQRPLSLARSLSRSLADLMSSGRAETCRGAPAAPSGPAQTSSDQTGSNEEREREKERATARERESQREREREREREQKHVPGLQQRLQILRPNQTGSNKTERNQMLVPAPENSASDFNTAPSILPPLPYPLHPSPFTPHPTPHTLNPTPQNLNPKL